MPEVEMRVRGMMHSLDLVLKATDHQGKTALEAAVTAGV